MDSVNIEREIERVEMLVAKNSTIVDVTGAVARGVWEIALQLAVTRERQETLALESDKSALKAVKGQQ